MERSIVLAALAALLAVGTANAQSDDFGIWGEANVEKRINQNLTIDGGVEFRSRDNAGEADRWSVGAGVTYKLTDWLKASAGYTLIDDHRHKVNNSGKKYADFWGLRHRFSVGLTASKSFGRLSLSLRERWQYTYRPEASAQRYYVATGALADSGFEHVYSGKGKNVWRNRLQAKYKVSKMWRPYLSVESNVSHGLEKMRYAAGTEIRLSKQHWLDAKYMYQTTPNDDDDEGNRHIIGVGYTFKF